MRSSGIRGHHLAGRRASPARHSPFPASDPWCRTVSTFSIRCGKNGKKKGGREVKKDGSGAERTGRKGRGWTARRGTARRNRNDRQEKKELLDGTPSLSDLQQPLIIRLSRQSGLFGCFRALLARSAGSTERTVDSDITLGNPSPQIRHRSEDHEQITRQTGQPWSLTNSQRRRLSAYCRETNVKPEMVKRNNRDGPDAAIVMRLSFCGPRQRPRVRSNTG